MEKWREKKTRYKQKVAQKLHRSSERYDRRGGERGR